jgi:hypothetical protein
MYNTYIRTTNTEGAIYYERKRHFLLFGTGNCLDMAKNIAKVLGDTDIIMMRSRPTVTDVKDAKRVGFVFPCYGGGLPGDVEKFVKLVEVSPDAYTFGVCQFAGYPGNGLHMIDEIVGLDYWAMMSHQCGYIVLFPHQLMVPPMTPEAAQARSERRRGRLARTFLPAAKRAVVRRSSRSTNLNTRAGP